MSRPSDAAAAPALSVSVIVCAYTLERWALLCDAIRSVGAQTHQPVELFLSVDHNRELFERATREVPALLADRAVAVRVIENRFDSRLGGARTSAAELATGDVLAFLDDDAAAAPDWLERLVADYADPRAVAVGGAPRPRFESPRPRWIPLECDWVFGCAYRGLPETKGPVEHLIGANMSIRRAALLSWGGFHSDNHDDMDLSHRTAHAFGADAVVFDPGAVVAHFVPASRLTWDYFWRRCFFVNRGKVAAFRGLGEASNLRAELRFGLRSLARGLVFEGRALAGGDLYAPVRYGVLVAALALGAAGNLAGRLR
ncbi:MAG TPA: glycosyltransferase family 2 protein [Acidimicrobiales bacterium]|nr:MAG: hypothetical protein B7Z69_00295 [Actinobacteria bacterium 21-73-9]HQU25534.1 glycosyltransferase family 2 protein [Acidimicrobiales bacterium]